MNLLKQSTRSLSEYFYIQKLIINIQFQIYTIPNTVAAIDPILVYDLKLFHLVL